MGANSGLCSYTLSTVFYSGATLAYFWSSLPTTTALVGYSPESAFFPDEESDEGLPSRQPGCLIHSRGVPFADLKTQTSFTLSYPLFGSNLIYMILNASLLIRVLISGL